MQAQQTIEGRDIEHHEVSRRINYTMQCIQFVPGTRVMFLARLIFLMDFQTLHFCQRVRKPLESIGMQCYKETLRPQTRY
jgi:hypothetical protein